MNEREALLRAVCENPDDDTPRLVFADWLDEHDEPERAEFIRVQIEAGRPFDRWRGEPPFLRALDPRVVELSKAYEGSWRAEELPAERGFTWGPFIRGFVDTLYADLTRTQLPFDCLPLVFEQVPVQDLRFHGMMDCDQFLSWPNLRHLRRLQFWAPGWSDEDWRRFAECPFLRDGFEVEVNVDFPIDSVREMLDRRFNIDFYAS